MRVPILAAAIILAASLFQSAAGQSASTVSGSDVRNGEDVVEYRFAFAPDQDGVEEAYAHRFHYQHGFSDSLRGRILLLTGRQDGEPIRTQSISAEVLYQFMESEESGGWDSAVRFDGTLSAVDGRPDRVRIGWHNAIKIGDDWEFRGLILIGKELGDNRRGGLTVETREEATVRVSEALRVGVQAFNNFNSTSHFGSFDEQRHQVGPILKAQLNDHVRIELGALFAASEAASDADARLFVTYGF